MSRPCRHCGEAFATPPSSRKRYCSADCRRAHGAHRTFTEGVHYEVVGRGYPTPCWIWKGSRNWKGYGRCTVGRRETGAHRVVYATLVGPIPEGLQLDHRCMIRDCVNPDHLEPVTPVENVRRSCLAKLTLEQAAWVRWAPGSQRALASRLGVSQSTIGRIKRGEAWRV